MRKERGAVLAVIVLASSVFGASYNCDRFEASDVAGMQQGYVDIRGNYALWQEDNGMAVQRLCGYDIVNEQRFTICDGVDGAGDAYKASGEFVVGRKWCNGAISQCLYGYDLAAREEFVIQENIGMLEGFAADANLMVWKQDCNEGMQQCLYGYDLEAREKFVISEPFNTGMLMGVRVSGEYVVWEGECEDGNGVALPGTSCLYGYDSVSRERFVMDSEFSDMVTSMLDADGGIAVWVDDCNEGMDRCIVGYDMNARAPFLIKERVGDMGWEACLTIAGGYVVWKEYDNAQGINQVRGYDVAGGEHFLIKDDYVAWSVWHLDINGRYVIIREDEKFWGYCLLSRELFVMHEPEMNIGSRELELSDEDLAVWIEDSWSGPERHDTVGYDLAYRQEFAIDANEGRIMPDMEDYGFEISGNKLVWREEQYDNYMTWYLVAGASIHRVDNDECRDATEIFDDQLWAGSTAWARGQDESSCGFGDSGDVWHYYKAYEGGQVTIRTDGSSFDTVLSVFNACGGDELACNDDYSIYHTDSKVELQVVKGKTYYIRVAGFNGASGDYQLLVTRGVCGTPIRSDLNQDCKVDMKDFAIFAADWLASDIQ